MAINFNRPWIDFFIYSVYNERRTPHAAIYHIGKGRTVGIAISRIVKFNEIPAIDCCKTIRAMVYFQWLLARGPLDVFFMRGVVLMILCATTNYAIRIMIEVAKNNDVISSSVLSARTGISQKYLKKITARLKEAGLLKSVPGHYGGYTLPCVPEKLSLWDIFEAIEPDKPLIALQRNENETGSGSVVKKLHSEMNSMLQRHFRAISLADLAEMSEDKEVIDL